MVLQRDVRMWRVPVCEILYGPTPVFLSVSANLGVVIALKEVLTPCTETRSCLRGGTRVGSDHRLNDKAIRLPRRTLLKPCTSKPIDDQFQPEPTLLRVKTEKYVQMRKSRQECTRSVAKSRARVDQDPIGLSLGPNRRQKVRPGSGTPL